MPTHANFTADWTITWPEFEDIRRKKISKIILPSYKNVVFRFRVQLSVPVEGNNAEKLRAGIFYEDGPLCSLDCKISCRLRKDTTVLAEFLVEWNFNVKEGVSIYWPNFEVKDTNMLKNKYGLDTSDDLRWSITISIPLTSFDCQVYKAGIEQRRGWLQEIFGHLKDVEKATRSDVRFVSGDGDTFYCHYIIVGTQSKELDTMLNNPKSDGEKSGAFCFPSLNTDSLNAILKYLYTGECDLLIELPVPLIIQVADFSEQYGLNVLKEASISQLWKIVVESPNHAIEILRFADLHADAKYLKDRSMDVIMENFEKFSLHMRDFTGGNNDDLQGTRLIQEYVLYTARRLSIDPQ